MQKNRKLIIMSVIAIVLLLSISNNTNKPTNSDNVENNADSESVVIDDPVTTTASIPNDDSKTEKDNTVNADDNANDSTSTTDIASDVSTDNSDNVKIEFINASDAVKQMSVGWNLGNTLDSCDFKKYSPLKSDYQIMAIYSNKEYSGWDASNAFYIGNDGYIELVWQIDSLNSALDGKCGSFSIQLINNVISDSKGLPVKFEVDKAQFTKKDGTVIELSDMAGKYESPLKKNVTENAVSDISNIDGLATATDIIGGELRIDVKITDYPIVFDEGPVKAKYYETLWKNPVTTKEMIDKVANAGFKAVRIPVTYYDHINEDGTIDEAWLKRVKEIVDYVLEDGMYCIINTHHDSGKLVMADMSTIEEQKANLASIWKQIANYFKNYDDKLMFESFNEILNAQSQWTNAGQTSYEAVNIINQYYVDTIRSTGGNNTNRNLILNTYADSSEQDVLDAFVLPNDSVQNHLITEVHYYSALSEEPAKRDKTFDLLSKDFIEKGIPVIIGEFASVSNWNKDDSISYIKSFRSKANENNIAVFWWDAGGKRDINSNNLEQLLNRVNLTWYSPDKLKAFLNINS